MSIPDVVWRGEPLPRLNRNELLTGRVQQAEVDVYQMKGDRESLRVGERNAFFGKDVEDIPGGFERESVTMTPGFTANIGTAYHFANTDRDAPGLILGFDPSAVSGLFPVEYDIDFMHANPGVLGRVETLANAEARIGDELLGLLKDGGVRTWGTENETRATSPTYANERELITYETDVPLDGALHTIICPVAVSGANPAVAKNRLADFEGFEVAYGSGTKTSYMDEEDLLENLFEQVTLSMESLPTQVVVLLLEDAHQNKRDELFPKEEFVAAYSSSGLIEDIHHPDLSVPGGSMFA